MALTCKRGSNVTNKLYMTWPGFDYFSVRHHFAKALKHCKYQSIRKGTQHSRQFTGHYYYWWQGKMHFSWSIHPVLKALFITSRWLLNLQMVMNVHNWHFTSPYNLREAGMSNIGHFIVWNDHKTTLYSLKSLTTTYISNESQIMTLD